MPLKPRPWVFGTDVSNGVSYGHLQGRFPLHWAGGIDATGLALLLMSMGYKLHTRLLGEVVAGDLVLPPSLTPVQVCRRAKARRTAQVYEVCAMLEVLADEAAHQVRLRGRYVPLLCGLQAGNCFSRRNVLLDQYRAASIDLDLVVVVGVLEAGFGPLLCKVVFYC